MKNWPQKIYSIGLALLLIACAITGCGVNKSLNYDIGFAKFEDRELDEAMILFQQIAQERGKYANRARYYIAECYRLQARWDEAVQQFQIVSDADPKGLFGAGARYRIAQIEQGLEALKGIEIVHVGFLNSDRAELIADKMLELGSIYEDKLEDYNNAIKAYQSVIERFPGTPKAAQAQFSIGNVYLYKTYDYTKAFEELKKVNEENYPGLDFLAKEAEDSLRDFNKTSKEIEECQELIRKSEKKKIEPGKRARGYDIYGARDDLVGQAFLAIGTKWRLLKNYPRAIKAYRITIERLPTNIGVASKARYTIVEIYQLDQGRYVEAIEAYQEYIYMHPESFRHEAAVHNLAVCYETLEMYDEAYEKYKEYCLGHPEGKSFRAAHSKVRQYELRKRDGEGR